MAQRNPAAEVSTVKVQIAIRLDGDVVVRLDSLAAKLSRPGMAVTRTDAMRVAIATGFDTIDAERKR